MVNLENYTILIVDDEDGILELVRYNTEKVGYKTICVGCGEDALNKTRELIPDLIILDLMLPGIDGLDVCRILKSDNSTNMIPILMLTAKGEDDDIIKGLEIGADDYVSKPFSVKVLLARIKSLLRRNKSTTINDKDRLVFRNLIIEPLKRSVRVNNINVELTYTEFQILHLFAKHPNLVFTRSQIIDAVRGENYPVIDRTVDFQIVGLRKKLGSSGDMIQTVRGLGYRILIEE
ncbi:MAG: response regulator [Candidatus Marinimicrobia bacterium]|nr:response regulator [Candidatus Neomarinimicrobiota bacterium]